MFISTSLCMFIIIKEQVALQIYNSLRDIVIPLPLSVQESCRPIAEMVGYRWRKRHLHVLDYVHDLSALVIGPVVRVLKGLGVHAHH